MPIPSQTLRGNPFGGTLALAILPTFGARWLAPRLPKFLAQSSGVTINMISRLTYFDFRLEQIDAAIHYGRPEWQGAELVLLKSETVIPVCSVELRDQFNFKDASDLRKAPLLHLTTRPDAWERWLMQNGVDADAVHGMLFDQWSTTAQSAIAGLGVALLPQFLFEEELNNGKLVRAIDLPMTCDESYYLVWPSDRSDHPPLVAFREWIVSETAQYR